METNAPRSITYGDLQLTPIKLQEEIAQLRAENAALKEALDEVNCPRKYVRQGGVMRCLYGTSSISAYEELETKNAALKKDAERYRWLRDNSAYVGVNPHAKTCLWVLRGIYEIEGEGFDAAIDVAMKESS